MFCLIENVFRELFKKPLAFSLKTKRRRNFIEKDNFADLAHFAHLVLEMGQVLVLELISPDFTIHCVQ